jgi:hypothetical protein
MKIVQTLGRAGGVHEGVFCYKRTSKGVHIDASISSKYTLKKKTYVFQMPPGINC